jgi:hypothetical protein
MMRKAYFIDTIILSTLLFFLGCVPETRNVTVVPAPHTLTPAPLPEDKIDERIADLSRFLEDKKGSEADKATAETLLETYKTVKKASQGGSGSYDYKKVILSLFDTLTSVDEQYFSGQASESQLDAKVLNRFSLSRKNILNLYLDGDYQGVINQCLELEASYGSEALTPDIGLLFSFSLAERGMLEDAVNIGSRLVPELEGKPSLMLLREKLIEWQISLGNREEASRIYGKLTDDMQDNEAILKQAEIKLEEKETRTALGDDAQNGPSGAEKDIGDTGTVKEVLEEVDSLLKQHQFQEAKMLLIRRRLTLEEGPDIETIDQALESVDLAEEKYRKEEILKGFQKDETLNSAMDLIEEEKFEEAITKLEALEHSQATTPEAGKLKGMAIERLINRERNKAAKLFLMAKNTQDPALKEELLVSSYDTLKVLIENYPTSPLSAKINDHMEKIKKELDKLNEEAD